MAYQGIIRAALEIAYANNGIRRNRPKEDFLKALDTYLAQCSVGTLTAIDVWLAGLDDETLLTVCDGDEADMPAAYKGAPSGTRDLMYDIFAWLSW